MALPEQPNPLPFAIASNGIKSIIPADNDGTEGLASIAKGFPDINSLPLAQGGIPPMRSDMNGLLNLLSQFLVYFQNGGVFAWNTFMDYAKGNLVSHGGKLYQCIADNGPNQSAGVRTPVGGENDKYWGLLAFSTGEGGSQYSSAGIPVGTIIARPNGNWASDAEAKAYLLCNGQRFSATDYPKLAKVLGTTTVPNLNGRFLQGSVPGGWGGGAGAYIAPGLPEIWGSFPFDDYHVQSEWHDGSLSGAFYYKGPHARGWDNGSAGGTVGFSAARCSPIYGNSSTVQPSAFTVFYYILAK